MDGGPFCAAQLGAPARTQRSGSRGERRSKGAGGVSGGVQPGTEQSGLCSDEGEAAQYLGKGAFFNLK